jgi:hypothetical protein
VLSVAILGLAGVEFVLPSLFAASCSLPIFKILSPIKIKNMVHFWYTLKKRKKVLGVFEDLAR